MSISARAVWFAAGCLVVSGVAGCSPTDETSTLGFAQQASAQTPAIGDLYAGSPYLGELRNSVVSARSGNVRSCRSVTAV